MSAAPDAAQADSRQTFVCADCGYGIRVNALPLPPCPMCRAEAWRTEPERNPDGNE